MASPIRVAAGVVRDPATGRILIARRPQGDRLAGLWEFPGGKLEPGETPETCLERELAEELGITTRTGAHLITTRHTYPWIDIQLEVYASELVSGTPSPLEHDSLQWVLPAELAGVSLAPADEPAARLISTTP